MSGDSGVPRGVRMVPERSGASTRVVLIRHGESACGLAGVVGGPKGCTGLSERGVSEAEALRSRLVQSDELLDASALYTSVLPRAVQTASIAYPGIGRDLSPVSDCELCELHPGEADGLTWREFSQTYGEPDFDAHPEIELCPGGESWLGFVERVERALSRIVGRHPGELVVVVCHGGVVEASLIAFMPVSPLRRRLKLRTEHTSMTEWELDESGWRLLRYNDAAHLIGLGEASGP